MLLENGGQDGQNAQQPTSGLAQAGGDVWIEKVVQISPRLRQAATTLCVSRESVVDKVARLENGIQPDKAVELSIVPTKQYKPTNNEQKKMK